VGNADVYNAARGRITSLVTTDNADVPVEVCPGWTVKDLVAHLAGSFGAYLSGDLEGASSPEWGNRQVKERKDASLEECISEWNGYGDGSAEFFHSTLGTVAAADVLAHEQDIRTALHRPGHRDEAGFVDAIELGLNFLGQKIQGAELPALRFVTEDLDQVIGGGEPQATLRTSTFELFRSLHGRRTPAQVRALDWDGDPTPWMDVFFLFGPAEKDVVE
jgi:uncharacterized protein (TIGR03083 family)